MKKIVFKPKPLSKVEKVYLDALAKRPADTIFRDIPGKVQRGNLESVNQYS